MKRIHLHITVDDLEKSVAFYETLFQAKPAVRKPGYAKFMVDDPRINLALGQRSSRPGLDHVGIQVDTDAEREDLYARLQQADEPVVDEGDVECCYAKSNKQWISDPSGVSWEVFQSLGSTASYGNGLHHEDPPAKNATTPAEQALPNPACC